MKKTRYSLSMFWNKRDMNEKTKEATISLTVNLPRQQFRVSLKLSATKVDFDKAVSTARVMSAEAKELKQTLNDYIMKAETILDRLQDPSKESFVRLFKSETDLFTSNKTDVLFFYQMKMDEAEKEGRIGTRNYYKFCKSQLSVYSPKVCFEEIDEKWLKTYQIYLKGTGNSDATISMKFRALRIMFNTARKQGFISDHSYPFRNFSISSYGKSKSVLYPAQLKALYDYEPKGIVDARAKAYFFFCYLGNGMNFKDMTCLKWKDIQNDSLTFKREKTKNSKSSNIQLIRVHLHDEMKKIILEHSNKMKSPDDYVFPVLRLRTDLLRQHSDRNRVRAVINGKLSKIGKALGFEVHLCLNLARHSFATMLKISGTPVSFISDAMGHTTSKTTEHYLKSIPDENLQVLSAQLLKFA